MRSTTLRPRKKIINRSLAHVAWNYMVRKLNDIHFKNSNLINFKMHQNSSFDLTYSLIKTCKNILQTKINATYVNQYSYL